MQSSSLIRLSDNPRPTQPSFERGTYFIQTWGCQMNEEDSEQIGLYLQQLGFRKASGLESAQVVLLNTCSVRKKPEDKAFSFMGSLAKLKEARPEMVIGVAGCMAQLRADEIRIRAPHVDFVVGTAQISRVPQLVEEALQARRFQTRLNLPDRRGAVVTDIPTRAVGRAPKLKAYVPIQYGCDKFCTFCIVPTTRGRERSRPTEEIIEEVSQLAEQGTKEVTLLGQTVNSYGKNLAEGRVSFAELLRMLNEIPRLERIRYTSPYPRDFKSDLIETIRVMPKVMEHLHMPLQSGSDAVLRRMKRIYTTEEFTRIVNEVRESIPGVAITTDIIVGFPGETEEQFEETLDFVRRTRFDGAYMFHYSTRPGTPAATMEQIPQDVKMNRHRRLLDLQNAVSLEINGAQVNRDFEVLVEGPNPKNPKLMQGYSRDFRALHFEGQHDLIGRTVQVKAKHPHPWGLTGRLV